MIAPLGPGVGCKLIMLRRGAHILPRPKLASGPAGSSSTAAVPNPMVTVISNVNNVGNVNDESINPIISSNVGIIANSNVNSSESISEENVINEQSTDTKLIMKCNLNILMSTVVLLVVNPAGVIWRKAKSRWKKNLLPASGPCLSSPLIVSIA